MCHSLRTLHPFPSIQDVLNNMLERATRTSTFDGFSYVDDGHANALLAWGASRDATRDSGTFSSRGAPLEFRHLALQHSVTLHIEWEVAPADWEVAPADWEVAQVD